MKKSSILLFFALALAFSTGRSQSPAPFSVRLFEQMRAETQLTYSFFTGPDAADFRTSVKGFGSGILDFFGMRTSMDIIQLGTDRLYLSVGAGFSVNKYRLSKNIIFGKMSDNTVTWMVDPDPTHNYVNTFFGYGKSKIITTSFYFPVDLNVAIGKNMMFSAGGYLDLNVSARYKMKYLVGEDKIKEIIRSAEFRNLNPSTTKIGLNVSVLSKKSGGGISASWSMTPFFKTGMGPDIHEARVTASYTVKKMRDKKKEQE
jgi:hypothetical protein